MNEMDIQKEREAFELWCVQDDEFCIHRYDGSIDYSDDYTQCAWMAWQAAKAQAVPDGFVLVPVDTLEECLNWADIAKWDSPSNEVDKKIAHHEAIIESAISAQEPTND